MLRFRLQEFNFHSRHDRFTRIGHEENSRENGGFYTALEEIYSTTSRKTLLEYNTIKYTEFLPTKYKKVPVYRSLFPPLDNIFNISYS